MSEGWPYVRLGEVLKERREIPDSEDLILGRTPIVSKISFDSGMIEVRRDGATRTGMILARPGDLVISGINAAKGAIAIYGSDNTGPIAATIHYGAYEPDPHRVVLKYLWWFFRSRGFRELLTTYVPGGIKTELKAKRLLPIPIPLPPLEEQRRIVARIEELAGRIEEARRLRKEAVEEAEALLFAACEDALLRVERRSQSRQLIELVDSKRGISYGIVQTGHHQDGGIPTLRAGDLRWFDVETQEVKHVAPGLAARYARTKLTGGELLLRIRGGVGELAVCPEVMIGGNVSREIAVIPLLKPVNPRFAMYVLAAPSNQERLRGHVKGTSYVGINLKDVRTLTLPVTSFEEQASTVRKLEKLRAEVASLKRHQAESEAELEAMMPAILDRAFKGELL